MGVFDMNTLINVLACVVVGYGVGEIITDVVTTVKDFVTSKRESIAESNRQREIEENLYKYSSLIKSTTELHDELIEGTWRIDNISDEEESIIDEFNESFNVFIKALEFGTKLSEFDYRRFKLQYEESMLAVLKILNNHCIMRTKTYRDLTGTLCIIQL